MDSLRPQSGSAQYTKSSDSNFPFPSFAKRSMADWKTSAFEVPRFEIRKPLDKFRKIGFVLRARNY